MRQEILRLVPKQFLCPYCGKWHKWNDIFPLEIYDSSRDKAQLICHNGISDVNGLSDFRFYFYHGFCYFSFTYKCERVTHLIERKILLTSMIEGKDKPIITFTVPFELGKYECSHCDCKKEGLCDRLYKPRHTTLKLAFEFEQSEYNEFSGIGLISKLQKFK